MDDGSSHYSRCSCLTCHHTALEDCWNRVCTSPEFSAGRSHSALLDIKWILTIKLLLHGGSGMGKAHVCVVCFSAAWQREEGGSLLVYRGILSVL